MSNIANKVKDVLTGREHTKDTPTDTTGTTHRHGASTTTGPGTTTTEAPITGQTSGPGSGAYRFDVPHQHDQKVDTTDALGTRTAGKPTGVEGYGSRHDPTKQGLHHSVYSDNVDTKPTGGNAYTSGVATEAYGPGSTTTGPKQVPVTSGSDRHSGVAVPGSTHHTTTGPHHHTTTGPHHHTTTGPHRTDAGNKLDPRVDSDVDGSTTLGRDRTTTTAGPHHTDIGNKLDPRVDSDMDGSNTLGRDRTTTTAGPHRTDVGNKLDPRVDSDVDGSTTLGRDRTTTTTGQHRTDFANKVDPRVDPTTTGTGGYTSGTCGHTTSATKATAPTTSGYTTGTGGHTTSATKATAPVTSCAQYPGPAPHTAGPHRYDLLNKLDPRVDSDLDGSPTIGGGTNIGNTARHDKK
jgi:hypothetical protein